MTCPFCGTSLATPINADVYACHCCAISATGIEFRNQSVATKTKEELNRNYIKFMERVKKGDYF